MRTLEATEGNMLTQSEDVPVQNRVFTSKVYLAVNDCPYNWKEISMEEVERYKEELRILNDSENI